MSKILWVDDDINNPELRPDLDALNEKGHELTLVSNIVDFIKLLNRTKKPTQYDCIIIDMMMPPGDVFDMRESEYGCRTGLLLIERIKKNASFSNSKIILYSISQDEELMEKCNDMGITYLNKAELLSKEFATKVEETINKIVLS